uniref:Uncharacterized protein n=1 Tax=Glossina pallidipes TaxID=7398 RepID=A0A1B0AIL0_GLOPL
MNITPVLKSLEIYLGSLTLQCQDIILTHVHVVKNEEPSDNSKTIVPKNHKSVYVCIVSLLARCVCGYQILGWLQQLSVTIKVFIKDEKKNYKFLLSLSLKATYKGISGYTKYIKNTLDAFNIQSVHAALRGLYKKRLRPSKLKRRCVTSAQIPQPNRMPLKSLIFFILLNYNIFIVILLQNHKHIPNYEGKASSILNGPSEEFCMGGSHASSGPHYYTTITCFSLYETSRKINKKYQMLINNLLISAEIMFIPRTRKISGAETCPEIENSHLVHIRVPYTMGNSSRAAILRGYHFISISSRSSLGRAWCEVKKLWFEE